MSKQTESYAQHVERLEQSLAPFAKRSFEDASRVFLDGGELYPYFSKQWEDPARAQRLVKRTPLQIERDRIVHSPIQRKLAEKYQVLYNGPRRVVRNYATHVNRLVQVTRAICRWLDLNGDFAEAIALGSKTGALPFVHASKEAVSEWVKKKIAQVDAEFADYDPKAEPKELKQLTLRLGDAKLPSWVQNLRSPRVVEKVLAYIPWAAGASLESAYTSGQEGYWMLATNPFTVECRPNSFCPETMFGIWRHSLGCPYGKDSFVHKFEFAETKPKHHEITWQHATYEAMAVSYADDITWSIENLNDANTAALLNGKKSIYDQLEAELSTDIPEGLMRAVAYGDAGALYTYFISDFNDNSERILAKLKDGCKHRQALREGARGAAIGLSESACEQLDLMKGFLNKTVFNELRVANRTKMLKTISEACMELLYRGVDDILPTFIKDKARIERWPETKLQNALVLLKDDVHRIQLAVDIFCEMSDQEIYDLVGIESL